MRVPNPSLLASTAAALVLGALPASSALAQAEWPNKPINYIVPFAPGGATDILGRIYSQHIGQPLGVPVVVENRPGTGGSLGSAYASRAKPDGYTLVGGTISSHAINVSIYPSIGYDPVESFEPVILSGTLPNVLVVNANSDIKTLEDLIERAKEKPNNLSFGSSGVGSSQHLAGELFASTLDTEMLHVPYKGSAPSLQALMGGEIDLLFDNITSAAPMIQSGHLRALGVTSTDTSPILPDVKPLADLGLDDYDVVSWQGVFVPAGTPREIVDRLHEVMHDALQQPETRKRLEALGLTVSGAGPDEFAEFQKQEVEKWAKVVKDAGIKME